MIEILTVIAELRSGFETVNDSDIRRVQRGLQKMQATEKPLGTIHNEALKKMWALANNYDVASKQAVLDSQKADSEEQAVELRNQACRYAALEELARDVFWVQAKDDIGAAAWQHPGAVGVREDWMLVAGAEVSGLAGILGALARRT